MSFQRVYTHPDDAPAVVSRVQDVMVTDGRWTVWFVDIDGLVCATVCLDKAEALAWAARVDPFYGLI